MAKITEKLGLKISVKSFAESLREFSKEANRAKGDVLQRIGFFIDRRRNVYVIIDDTPDIRYGKKVFAAAYQHNNTFNTRLWQDTIVDCAVFHNEAYINNYFEVYVPKGYIERTTGKKGEEIEIRTKIEIAITIVKEAVAWLLSLGFSKKRIHILSDSWYDSRSFIGTIKEEKYFKNAEGKKVFYKETRLYVPDVGYLKFFRFKEEDKEEKYIATTKLDMCPKSAYRHKKKEWKEEEMHEEFLIFWSYKIVYSDERTIEQIWWDYCLNYDKIIAYNNLMHNPADEQEVIPLCH